MATMIVPPGGFRGFAQMTPASQRALFSGGPRRAAGRSRRARASAPARRRAPARARAGVGARRARAGGRKLKFGSPAWQKKYRVGAYAKRRK